MEKDLTNFVAQAKSWLFAFESELSLGTASSLTNAGIYSGLLQLDRLVSKADKEYSYSLDSIISDFPRVYKEYSVFNSVQ